MYTQRVTLTATRQKWINGTMGEFVIIDGSIGNGLLPLVVFAIIFYTHQREFRYLGLGTHT